MRRIVYAAVVGVLGAMVGIARAGESSAPEVVALVLHPAAPPRPALKYRLQPTVLQQHPGNAATAYFKAIVLLGNLSVSEADWEQLDKWLSVPPDALPRPQVREKLLQFADIVHQLDIATRRTECDWGLPIHEEENVLTILLPEVDRARRLARLLALRARLHMAERDFDAALGDLAAGYTMARHVASAPFLVNGLVGISIAGMMNAQLETLVQLPAAPNLYWALTALPQPPVDLRRAYEMEAMTVSLLTPEIRDVRTTRHTPDEWSQILGRVISKLAIMVPPLNSQKSPVTAAMTQVALMASLPVAKEKLIASGHAPQEIASMSPSQIILLHMVESYEHYRDEEFKWFGLPYWQAAEGIRQAEAALKAATSARVGPLPADPGLFLPGLLLPAIGNCRLAEAKLSRRLAELQIIEAIRAYAADHEGKLPGKLDDIRRLPLPGNPVTGKPFEYRLEADSAVLTCDGPPDSQPRQYRLRMSL